MRCRYKHSILPWGWRYCTKYRCMKLWRSLISAGSNSIAVTFHSRDYLSVVTMSPYCCCSNWAESAAWIFFSHGRTLYEITLYLLGRFIGACFNFFFPVCGVIQMKDKLRIFSSSVLFLPLYLRNIFDVLIWCMSFGTKYSPGHRDLAIPTLVDTEATDAYRPRPRKLLRCQEHSEAV